MSKGRDKKKLNFSKVRTYPLSQRESKVDVSMFASVPEGDGILDVLASMPPQLKALHLRELVEHMLQARKNRRALIWMMGAHPIKCGLTPLLVDLAERGFITHLATNGASAIHDVEIAMVGKTSEDVEAQLAGGNFGLADETGTVLAEVMERGAKEAIGYGRALGEWIEATKCPYRRNSLFWHMHRLHVPFTVHMCIGTDIIVQHPAFDGASAGKASFIDFRIFSESVADLEGGVIINLGSAVILPETFLKALNLVRNLGYKVENFFAANFDMINHYRPVQNVLMRPTGGKGVDFRGHHEIMIPLLAGILRAMDNDKGD